MSTPKRKGSKSRKADGTPKKRWTSEQRAARGHGPRRRGGRDRFEDQDQSRKPNRWSSERHSDSQAGDRFERSDRFDRRRDDRPRYRDDRPATDRDSRRFDRDKPRYDRDSRGFSKEDRGRDKPRFDRDSRRSFGRDESPRYAREERVRFDRDDRRDGRRFDRDDRPRFGRDDRSERRFDRDRPRFDRDDRPRFGRDKPRFDRDDWGRDDRRSFGRDDRRSDRFGGDDKPRFNRDDKPRFDRDERPRFGRDKPRFDRDSKPRFGRDERPRARRDDRPRFNDERHEARSWRERDEDVSNADTMDWSAGNAPEIDQNAVVESGFDGLGVPANLCAALSAAGINDPFPIQSATIPDALAGRDVLGRGRTGSGKTLAFGLPMMIRLSQGEPSGGAPRAIVLTPTRELALQIADNLSPLARTLGLDLTLIAGGMSYGPQLRAFERGVDIVIATPGRLIDLINQGVVDLTQVQVSVLDEADHMADLGFMPDVTTVLDLVPADGQRLLFSATLDDAVSRLVKRYLHDPVTHEVDSSKASVTTMVHRVLHVHPHHKNQLTAEVANREGRTVIFMRTQRGADRVAGQLRDAGVMAGALHGGLTQGARARVLAAFKEGTVPVLVATDVAARGIHVDDVSLVLQADPPRDHKDYLHRAGRTARAGESGVVASIVLPHQRKTMRRITGQAGVKGAPHEVEPGTVELREMTGARPASGVPIAESDFLALIAPKEQPRKRGGGRRFGGGRRSGFGGRPRGRSERRF